MKPERRGVLPDSTIAEMIRAKMIRSGNGIRRSQIQPASLDMRLGDTAHRVRASFLAGKGRTVEERLQEFGMHKLNLANGAVLEKGCVYVVPLQELLALPPGIEAAANAKSSTGRLDLFTRLIIDEGTEFDRIGPGYKGPLYVEICPRSFSVLVRSGTRLNQVRFRRGIAGLSDEDLKELHAFTPLVAGTAHIDDGLGFSVDLVGAQAGHCGYRAKQHTGIIDVDAVERYDPNFFWEAVSSPDGHVILDPGSFYILVSQEAVTIPPEYAAEMVPYLAVAGEFRVHYAGFFDPGFGHGGSGGTGSRGVLEIRCHEAPFLLEHGQTVGRLKYERMALPPMKPYGSNPGSHYQGQGLRLSKHFR